MRAHRYLSPLTALVLLLASVGIVRAADVGTCGELNSVSRFKGHGSAASSMAGAQANLEAQALNYCNAVPAGSDSSHANHIFVGVDGNDSKPKNIVQLGIIHCYAVGNVDCEASDPTHVFRAWGRDHNAAGCTGFSDVLPVPVRVASLPAGTQSYQVGEDVQPMAIH